MTFSQRAKDKKARIQHSNKVLDSSLQYKCIFVQCISLSVDSEIKSLGAMTSVQNSNWVINTKKGIMTIPIVPIHSALFNL